MKTEDNVAQLAQRNPGEQEYLQAAREVPESIEGVYNQNPQFESAKIIERLVEPDRIITFKVSWLDDERNVRINPGYRIQFNNALKMNWTAREVDARLHQIMIDIHYDCDRYGKRPDGYVDYVKGANVAGFLKVVNIMPDLGVL